MPFPVGVTLRNVAFSPITDAEDGVNRVVRALVTCNEPLVHIPTGVVLLSYPQFLATPIPLPVTNQVGNIWSNGKGQIYSTVNGAHTHSYRVDFEYQLPDLTWIAYRSINKLLLPSGAGDLDLDLAVDSLTFYTVS